MSDTLPTMEFPDRRRWRAWLEKNHTSSAGLRIVFYKIRAGKKGVAYEDAVREALSFGWVDSLIRRLDDDRYTIKFTPRRPTSKWSDINRRRWAELKAEGRLAPAGLAAAPTDNRYAKIQDIPELPSYIEEAFRAHARAWAFFEQLAPSYRKYFVAWIHTAKRPETREKRIRESIVLLAAGRKLGLK
jgi:uncharacterized protein YdeI (YjbR/CyaY-like superfamily)